MTDLKLEIKLAFVTGLRDVVLSEINKHKSLHILREDVDDVYVDFVEDFTAIKSLRSVARAYVVVSDSKCNPLYISKHKSILGDLIEFVINNKSGDVFKTFKISCAGTESKEVRRIAEYVRGTYNMVDKEEADLKIHIIKHKGIWEMGIQITPRPLSFRSYKVKNMSGAMDPTIAYAVNSLCELEKIDSYLNVFSGSATLLIEAGQCYPNIKQLVGFDNDKKHISLAIQNVKKAGLIKRVQLKEKDIFDNPDLGKFDLITSDLPFGMAISKNDDLEKLYQQFVEYCQETLTPNGIMVIYTSEYKIFEKAILKSKFKIIKQLELKFITSVNAYLHPKIFVCRFK